MYKKINAEENSGQTASNKKFITIDTLILLDYFYSLKNIPFANPNTQPVEHDLFFPPTHALPVFHPPGNMAFS